MKRFSRLLSLFAAGGLAAMLCTPSMGQVTPVKPEDASRHFAAVSKHLELGGPFFAYIDVDGDLSRLAPLADKVMDMVREQGTPVSEEWSSAKMMDSLGLNCVKAVGMSSRKLGNDLFHNRALIYMPEGPKGLMKLFGGKAAPYRIPAFAPTNAGVAMQMDLSLGTLLQTAEEVIKATGQDSVLNQFKIGLAFPVPGMQMSAGELMGKLNTRVLVSMRFDETKKLNLPGMPVACPGIQIMVALEDIDFIMEPLLAMAEVNGDIVIEKDEAGESLRPKAALPGDLDYFKPALYHDRKTKRLILTSHLDLAKSAGTGETLGTSAAFKKAMEGLPAEGNGLSYATPEFVSTFYKFYLELIKASAAQNGTPPGMDGVLNSLMEMMPIPATPVASAYANVPDGMLFMSNNSESHKSTVAQFAVVPVSFLVGAVAGYSNAQRQMSGPAKPPLRARLSAPAEEPPAGEPPAKAVKNNLQQIAFSAQTYFLDNPKENEVAYETLVKSELIFDLDPVAGESYKGLTLKRGGGEMSVKPKAGDAITLKYRAAE